MPTFITAVISAIVGFFIAFGLFRAQRTWTEKRDAYIELLNALSTLIEWASSESLSGTDEEVLLSPHQQEIAERDLPDALHSISRHRALGGIVISMEAGELCSSCIDKYHSSRWEYSENSGNPEEAKDVFYQLQKIFEAKQKELNEIAKRELHSTFSWMWSYFIGTGR